MSSGQADVSKMLLSKLFFILIIVALFSTSMCKVKIVKTLKARYNEKKMHCVNKNNEKKPAYFCSGILLRGVRHDDIVNGNLKHFYSLKAHNHGKTSFSVAFLRKDSQFSRFRRAYDSGFIMYPPLKSPKKKNTYKVYCAFPVNG